MNNQQISFDQFLKENLTYSDYINLSNILGESEHRVTKIKNDPATGRMSHIAVLIPLIKKVNKQISAEFLFMNYDFGKIVMTPAEIAFVTEKSVAL